MCLYTGKFTDSFHSLKSFLSALLKSKIAMFEDAIIFLYAKGMTVRDIQATLQDLYHVDVSHTLISKVTDVVNEEVQQ